MVTTLFNIIPLFLNRIGGPQIIIILVIVLLLFGGKKIPELMRGLGKGVKAFKQGLNDAEKEINSDDDKDRENKETDKK